VAQKAARVEPEGEPERPGAEFERFEDLARRLVKVSKREIDEKRQNGTGKG
jgi:hypothetical protein